jgi:hypothetical protein
MQASSKEPVSSQEQVSAKENVAVNSKLPDFIAVGPPRSATTWLYRMLKGHVSMPAPVKEALFFDRNFDKGLKWYIDQFEFLPLSKVGEIAPTYFFAEQARKRIAELIPNCKIVVTFRDPVPRLYSHYQVRRALGLTHLSFPKALDRDPELSSSARYAFHLREWTKTFGKSNIQVMFYDDLTADAQNYLDEICRFINIPRIMLRPHERFVRTNAADGYELPKFKLLARLYTVAAEQLQRRGGKTASIGRRFSLRRYLFGGGGRLGPLEAGLERRLRALLTPEVEALEQLIGRDLSAWKAAIESSEPRHRQAHANASSS